MNINERVQEVLDRVLKEQGSDLFARTDQGLVDRFAALYHDRVRFVPDEGTKEGTWRRWTGTHWRYATPIEIQSLKDDVQTLLILEAAAHSDDKDALAFARRSQSMASTRNMVSLAAAESSLWARLNTFDRQPELLNFTNGTLDLRTGDLRPHDPSDMITQLVPHKYQADEAAPKWRALVDRALQTCGDDGATASALQTVFGHALFGRNYDQHMVIIKGEPRAGKSKMIEIVNALLGPDYCHTSRPDLVIRRGQYGHHESEIYTLRRKRFVSISETDAGMTFDETRVKDLTGADKVTTRRLHTPEEVAIDVSWAIFVATNEAPNVRHWDGAVARRLVVFPIGPSLEPHEVNTNLAKEIIEEEAEGVLAWLVEGAKRWADWNAKDGRPYSVDAMPKAVRDATNAYAEENNPVVRLLNEHLSPDPSGVFDFKAAKARLGSLGGGHVSDKALSKRLEAAGYERNKPSRGKWSGARLLEEGENADFEPTTEQQMWFESQGSR